MRNILLEIYLEKNLGDDLFLKVLLERYPKINFSIIVDDMTYCETYKNFKNINFIKRNIHYKLMSKFTEYNKVFSQVLFEKFDGYLIIGGSIFMEVGDWERIYNYRKILIEGFKRKNKPTYIIGANFGPYKNNNFIELYKNLFSKCNDICFRDSKSFNLFSDMKNVRLGSDVIFLLNKFGEQKEKNSIGISIMDLQSRVDLANYNEIYKAKMVELINYYINNGFKVKLLSFCKKEGDEKAINIILNQISNKNKDYVSVLKYNGNIDLFLRQYEKIDQIIGLRFHSCILSQVYNQDLFPIIYSKKTLNLLEDIHLANNHIEISQIANFDINKIQKCLNNNQIEDLEEIYQQANKQFIGFDHYVSNI